MDNHNCGGNLIPNVVMLKRSGGRYWVDGFRCSYCGEEIIGRDTALSIEKLERERDELLAACEAGGEYDGDEIDGPLALRLTARYLDYSFYGELSALLNEKADAEEAAIAKVKGAADE